MRRSIAVTVLFGIAALPAVAIAVALGAYMLSKSNDQMVSKMRIILPLHRPDDIRKYISEWIPFLPGESNELVGSIEGKPVEIVLTDAGNECAFESSLVTVNMDVSKNGSVKRIFISSTGMALTRAISSMRRILEMLNANHEKLEKWSKGALSWSEDPKLWPKETPTPMDAWYSEIVRTKGIECELEIRRSDGDGGPWRVVIRTGPRLFSAAPAKEPQPEQGQHPTSD